MKCRVCHTKGLFLVWDFGPSPLANNLRKEPNTPETYYPLQVYFCVDCKNVQLGTVIDPKVLFSHYLYASSTSPVFRKHFEDFSHKVSKPKKVVDIGSNDGILLKPFQDMGCEVIGVEPSDVKSTVPTIRSFFTRSVAKKIGKSDLITCTNTFAHIDNIDEITRGVKLMMGKNSVFVIEVQYLMDQLKNKIFDNVYHEHVQYWSVTALKQYFERHRLYLSKVEHIPTHGGSIRVYIQKDDVVSPSVHWFMSKEDITFKRLTQFEKEVRKNKIELLTLLYKLKAKGKRIVGYGAPAKATTLLNYFGIGSDVLDYIVDDSPLKHGYYTPGKNIPIRGSILGKPDYILVLAWNFADSIIKNHPRHHWIIPSPKVRMVWS